jgi:hypothetical protein
MSTIFIKLLVFASIFAFPFAIVKVIKNISLSKLRKKLVDLNDCPFKFHIENGSYSPYVIFDFGTAKLYCSYKSGIRSDGIYGVKEISLEGINSSYGSHIELSTGQSIFPIIRKMDEFEQWTKTKAFKTSWEVDFKYCWEDTLKSIDNLRYLETKSKEEENDK